MSIAEPTVALVFSPEGWVEQLHRHLADHGGARIRQIVVEPSTLRDEEFDVLVVSHRWPALTPVLVRRVQEAGARVLGVFDRDEPAAREHLARIGVDAIVGADVALRSFVEAIRAVGPEHGERTRRTVVRDHFDEPTAGVGIVAVGGPCGGGKTELSVAIAMALADRGCSVVLLDADVHAAAIAIRLRLPLHANLRTAVATLQAGGDVARSLVSFGRVAVLPGSVTSGHAHFEPAEVLSVLSELHHRYDHIVIDTSGVPGEPLGRALLGAANVALGISAAGPVELSRLVSWTTDAAPSFAARLSLVINRAPKDAYRRGEVVDELGRAVAAPVLALLPFDERVVRAAWDARSVERGAFVEQVRAIVDASVPQHERRADRRRDVRHRSGSEAA